MKPNDSIGLTNNIREVFGYIKRFKDQVFILKIDDELLDTPLLSLLVKDIVLIKNMGIHVILVLGARNSIDQVLSTYKVKTEYHDGIRLTSNEALPLVKLGASNVGNTLLTLLSENGVSGVMGNWVKAREIGVIEGLDYQNTGKVSSIKLTVIRKLLEEDMIPILTNIGWNSTGKPYNISSNEVAVTLSKNIHASKLFFLGTLSGISAIENSNVDGLEIRNSGVYSALEIEKARELLNEHSKDLSHISKDLIEMALEACAGGVNRVHVIDGRQDGILLQEIFSTKGQGTMFHRNVYANIRPAKLEDIPGMLHIMQPYVERGVLIQRSSLEISENLSSYYVYAVDDALHGCCALTKFSNNDAEIEAVVVDPHFSGKGTGGKMVSFLLEKARDEGSQKVIVLTTQTKDYFLKFGFKIVDFDVLPEEKRNAYNKNRNSKVLAVSL